MTHLKSHQLISVSIIITLIIMGFVYFSQFIHPTFPPSYKEKNYPSIQIKNSAVTTNETWSGEIFVTSSITVYDGATLTITPGTIIKFQHYRGYKDPHLLSLEVYGTIDAQGNATDPIWFTSDGEPPINGDWSGITLVDSENSVFNYTIVEYAILGIGLFNSDTVIANSIIRWVNTEGYYAEYSKPLFINNTLYGCGYHEIALEQFNNATIKNNIFKNGTEAIHTENTNVTIQGNFFANYSGETMSFDALSNATVKENKFDSSLSYPYISVSANSNLTMIGNDNSSGTVPIPVFDYQDVQNYVLGYLPGDPIDQYLYIFDTVDETRRVVKKIGAGLSFGWAITYAMGYLWRFDFWQEPLGSMMDFIKLDPVNGNHSRIKNDFIQNARGLTYDGQFFYVYDHSNLQISKFTVVNNTITINMTFPIPNQEEGGTAGLTSDGEFLYIPSRDGDLVRKLDKNGNKIEDIQHNYTDGVSSLVWTGAHFWALTNNGNITKFTAEWQAVGEIYQAAIGTWAIDWDGEYLWILQRTCEKWMDAKVYQVEPLISTITKYVVQKGDSSYIITIKSNSSDSWLRYNETLNVISYEISGVSGTNGFSDLVIPNDILFGPFAATIDGIPIPVVVSDNETHVFLHLEYEQSEHEIRIFLKETSPNGISWNFIIPLTLLMILILVFKTYRKRKK